MTRKLYPSPDAASDASGILAGNVKGCLNTTNRHPQANILSAGLYGVSGRQNRTIAKCSRTAQSLPAAPGLTSERYPICKSSAITLFRCALLMHPVGVTVLISKYSPPSPRLLFRFIDNRNALRLELGK